MKLRQAAHVAIAMTLLAGCGRKSTSSPETFFPASGEVAAWSRVGETRTFEAGDLWQYIDGDAERYLQAGVQRTLTTDYRYKGKVDAAVDVHVMRTPAGARKIFEGESPVGSQPVELGDSARLYGSSFTFRKGLYFVRVVAYAEEPGLGAAVVELARGVERRLTP